MNYLLSVAVMSVVMVCYHFGMKQIYEFEQRQIEREKELRDWLFDSLYTINAGVKLPPEIKDENEPGEEVAGGVYSPLKDPLNKLHGQGSDFYDSN